MSTVTFTVTLAFPESDFTWLMAELEYALANGSSDIPFPTELALAIYDAAPIDAKNNRFQQFKSNFEKLRSKA